MFKKKIFLLIGGGVMVLIVLVAVWASIPSSTQPIAPYRESEKAQFDNDVYSETSGGYAVKEMAAPAPSAVGGLFDTISRAREESVVQNVSDSSETNQLKIIKTGTLDLAVKKVSQAFESITQLVSKKEGFVADSSINTRDDGTQYGNVVVRVPVKDFEASMNEIKKLAEKVEEERISGTDVTEEYIDLQSRLKNLRLEEEQYQTILKDAQKVDEILQVTAKLFEVRGNIEVIEGRIKYLENLTDLATINIYLSEEPKLEVPTGEWRPFWTIKNALRSTVRFWQGLVNVLIWLVILILPLAIVVWLIIKIIKVMRKKRKTKAPAVSNKK